MDNTVIIMMKWHNMRKMNKKKIYAVLIIAALIFGAWFIRYSYGLYQERLATEERISQAGSYDAVSTNDWEVVEFQGKTYERNPSVKAILFMGVDTSGEMVEKMALEGGQADTVLLAAHNTAEKSLRILMIPRDTMTPIVLTDLTGKVIGKDIQHITLAYAYGDGMEQSCERMSEAVSELLGLPMDGYMSMNTSMIGQLNDLVGGVTVTIEVDGLEIRDPALTKGSTVTLNGRQAEIFNRYRDITIDHSALNRMSQQAQYIEAYLEAVRTQAAKDDQTIVRIMDLVESDMITNLGKPQYMEMAMAVLNSKQTLGGDDILVLPGEGVVTDWFDEFHHDPEETRKMVLDLFYREK